MISKHPLVGLVFGFMMLCAACFGTFYSALAVGVSDGPGHLTAQVMLAACILVLLAPLFSIGRSARTLWVRL